MGHALLSPSSAHRWLKCGYCLKGTKLTGLDYSFANEGTRAHKLAEMFLNGAVKDYLSLCVNANGYSDTNMLTYVKQYIDYIQQYTFDKWYTEKQLTITPNIWGTADFVGYNRDGIHVFDLKYGKTPVSVEDNPQLQIYAMGALLLFKVDKPVYVHICQPRIGYFNYVILRKKEMKELFAVLQKREKELRTDIEKVPGPHCKYCPVICEFNHRR